MCVLRSTFYPSTSTSTLFDCGCAGGCKMTFTLRHLHTFSRLLAGYDHRTCSCHQYINLNTAPKIPLPDRDHCGVLELAMLAPTQVLVLRPPQYMQARSNVYRDSIRVLHHRPPRPSLARSEGVCDESVKWGAATSLTACPPPLRL